MRTTIAAAAAALALLACSDTLAPVIIGDPYYLWRVNGQPLPWSTPPADSQYIPSTIVDGSVTFVSDSLAERYESYGHWVHNPAGDSTWLAGAWTQVAIYRRGATSIVLTYPSFMPGSIGPAHAAETLYVTSGGGLQLRETGLVAPLDTIIRVYCAAAAC